MCRRFLFIFMAVAILTSCTEKGSQPDTTPVIPQPAPKVSQPTTPEPKQEKPQEPRRVWRTVKRVVDGDTIVLHSPGGEETVRLIGVDTPETVDPRKPVERFGKEASEFTRKLVEGKKVWLEYDQVRTDKYLRTLAYVHFENGRILNEEVIRYGYGHAYTEYPFKYIEKYQELERQAREADAGLWAKEASEPTHLPAKKVKETPVQQPVVQPKPRPQPQPRPSVTVYITRTGSKYHRSGCRYLRKSCIPISLEDAKRRYSP